MFRIVFCLCAGLVTLLVLLVYFLIAWVIGSDVWAHVILIIIVLTLIGFYYLFAKVIEEEWHKLDEMGKK